MPLAKSLGVPLNGRRKAQIVEQRRMKQVRQVADRVQGTVRDRAGVFEQVQRPARRFNGVLRERQLDLDGRQYLADFVVQFACDAPSFLFLRGKELRGEALKIARVLDVLEPLASNTVFQSTGVEDRQQRDAKAGRDRQSEAFP